MQIVSKYTPALLRAAKKISINQNQEGFFYFLSNISYQIGFTYSYYFGRYILISYSLELSLMERFCRGSPVYSLSRGLTRAAGEAFASLQGEGKLCDFHWQNNVRWLIQKGETACRR